MTVDAVRRPPSPAGPQPSLVRVGGGHPVVVVDALTGDVPWIRNLAIALAPYPPAPHFYPGVRYMIEKRDEAAWAYVQRTAEAAAPFVAGAFDCSGFELIEASFSIVATPPSLLAPPQRAPHFDSTDPDLVAMLHCLGDVPGSATAFFLHRATGIEQINGANVASYVATAQREADNATGYVQGTNEHYLELGRFETVADRLLIYRGSLLHSGIIPPDMPLDPDPMMGRLTANYFLRLTH